MRIYKFSICLALFLLCALRADAAVLGVSQQADSYSIGDVFTVNVVVASSDQAMNAVSGTLSFPNDLLEVLNISKATSIINFWPEEPTFSNANGKVTFEGVVINPGYTGAKGRVLTISFRAKKSGLASLSYPTATILANDGLGTNILESTRGAQVTINGLAATTPTSPSNEFTLSEIKPDDPTAPKVSFLLIAKDKNSSIKNYEIQVDDGQPTTIPRTTNDIFTTDVLVYGKHVITAKGLDNSGQSSVNSADFEIAPINPPEIIPPNGDLGSDALELHGHTYANSKVYFTVTGPTSKTTKQDLSSDTDGNFDFIYNGQVTSGSYTVTAYVVDSRGAVSPVTQPLTVKVKAPEVEVIGKQLIIYLIIIIILLIIIGLLLLFIILLSFKKYKKKVRGRTQRASGAVKKTFKVLGSDLGVVKKYITVLENAKNKRKLSEEEEQLLRQFNNDLSAAEKYIKSEIENIDKA